MTTRFRRKKKIMREREPLEWLEWTALVFMVILAGVLIYIGGAP